MKQTLERLLAHETLSKEDASAALRSIASGEVPAAQIASFLTIFRMREVTAPELGGFRAAMLDLAVPLHTTHDVVDLCGTGGDGKNTFNISTTASFIVAACGTKVAKHGNYGISSVCGSSNVLEFLGVPFARDATHANLQLDRAGITFLHAPMWHPAMKAVAPVRRELGFKTIFNVLGPLVNPARPKFQLVGTHSRKLQKLYAEILIGEGIRFTAIHSADGYDEISLTGEVYLSDDRGERTITAQGFGASTIAPSSLECGDSIPQYAAVMTSILEGKGTAAQSSVVAANAAAALALSRPGASLPTLYSEALDAINTGAGAAVLAKLKEIP